MTDSITVTLDDERAQAAFAELIKRGTDTTGLMRHVGGHLADVVLWDRANQVLLFARRGGNGDYMTLIARIDRRERRACQPVVAT